MLTRTYSTPNRRAAAGAAATAELSSIRTHTTQRMCVALPYWPQYVHRAALSLNWHCTILLRSVRTAHTYRHITYIRRA